MLILGLGISGRSAARFCAQRGAQVVAADERDRNEIEGLDELPSSLEIVTGDEFPDPANFDLVVPSPGVPREAYEARARRAWGDIELAFRALEVPIVAVTGTNGKTTTVTVLEAMLRASGMRVKAAGNVGLPALDLVGKPLDLAILEVSSFQLESTESFRPRVAVILNITPDHLDRHGSFEEYASAKARILTGQTREDIAILNFDDPTIRSMAGDAPGRVLAFSTREALPEGAWCDAGHWILRPPAWLGQAEPLRVSTDGSRLSGAHNRENVTAALTAAFAAGADVQSAAAALATFEGLPHRAQTVKVLGDVTFVNDSKATNPGAALRSLASWERPVIWIAGGRDKGLDFEPLARVASERVRTAILIGESAETLSHALTDQVDVRRADSLDEAVREAARLAQAGDVVLLAPACASQDQFRDFAARGERFCKSVEQLGEEAQQ
ncbi:UDP-N-acetylmuramoyl-L-alanine--D-glutamate ligase [Myxococcota bacterium]|nr:UDP-N-acetylmuramoyl-L-alanine--D-glutamate ligase [Myxococcota bacterium]